jgi:hypothetical protein
VACRAGHGAGLAVLLIYLAGHVHVRLRATSDPGMAVAR